MRNANEVVVAAPKSGLKVKTRVKAGGRNLNSNETILDPAGESRRKAGTKARAKKRG